MMMLASSSSGWINRFQVVFPSHDLLYQEDMFSLAVLQPPARSCESHTLLSWCCAILQGRVEHLGGWNRTIIHARI